jgi:hypothetical protein
VPAKKSGIRRAPFKQYPKGRRGKRPSLQQKEDYFKLRAPLNEGGYELSNRAACKRVRVSEHTGLKWAKEGLMGVASPVDLGEDDGRTPKPKLLEELDPEARKALDDFPFFCKRYLDLEVPAFWVEIARIISCDPKCETARRNLEHLHPHLRGLTKDLLPPEREKGSILQLLLVVHPGVGKTTLVLAYILWRINQERANENKAFATTFGTKADRLARRGLRQLKDWMRRPQLIEAFGRFEPESDDENTLWTNTEIAVAGMGAGKEATVAVYSRGASIRGVRPHLSVWDDLIDEEDADPQKTKEIAEWWDENPARRVEPGGALVVVGNYVSPQDFYHLLGNRTYSFVESDEINEEQAWHVVKYPAHDEVRCPNDGTHPAYPVGCLLWPDRWSYKQLERIRQDDADKFQVQYQLTDEGTSEILVPEIWIKGGVGESQELYPGCLDEAREMWDPIDFSRRPLIIGTLDPSPTKFAAAEIWAGDGDVHHLLALERRKMKTPEYPGFIAEWTQRTRSVFGHMDAWIIERTGSRYLHDEKEFQALWPVLGIMLIPHETQRNKRDPDYGVWSFRNHFRFGRIRMPWAPGPTREAVRIFYDEHKGFPYAPTDDTVLAHWFYHLHKDKITPVDHEPVTLPRPSWLSRGR